MLETTSQMNNPIATPFSHPIYVMTKPVGASCNLRCSYCYYLEKKGLYPSVASQKMSDETLELFIQQYIESQTMQDVLFTWHGGEPLLRPLSFYKKVVRLQQRYARGRHIDNCLQTNGTLLTDEWCEFLHNQGWLVGISIDGTEELHNENRLSVQGKPTYWQVMRGIRLLEKHRVEWNAMAVVNEQNVKRPLEFYRFFKSIRCHYIQFTPLVEQDRRISAADWGNFLCTLFDEWVKEDVGEYFVQLFDATLANWCGVAPGVCSMAETCGHAGVMEYNGDLYSCDHFVYPQYKLGNIHQQTITEMMYSPRQLQFGSMKRDALPQQCLRCEYLFACHGECPKNRIALSKDGEKGLNHLCEGYHRFFSHVAPYMDFMKSELQAGRAPANVMQQEF